MQWVNCIENYPLAEQQPVRNMYNLKKYPLTGFDNRVSGYYKRI